MNITPVNNTAFCAIFHKNHNKPDDKKPRPEVLGDVFSPSFVTVHMPGQYGFYNASGRYVKNIKLKNASGQDTKGFIIQDAKDRDTYYACTNECALAKMSISKKDDCIFIKGLHGQNNNGEYKGAGTELLRLAVEKSKQEGFDGKIKLCIGGSHPFYFKSNFLITDGNGEPDLCKNAALDYITRNNIPVNTIWKSFLAVPRAVLYPKEADMLSSKERVCDKSSSGLMYTKHIEYSVREKKFEAGLDIDFCDLSNYSKLKDTYVIQAVLRPAEDIYLPAGAVCMRVLEDMDGHKYLKIERHNSDFTRGEPAETAANELENAVLKKAKELGAEYIEG